MVNPPPSRHRIIPMAAPGVAGAEAPECQPAAAQRAVLLYGFQSVGAARGCVTALHAQKWRYSALIKADDSHK